MKRKYLLGILAILLCLAIAFLCFRLFKDKEDNNGGIAEDLANSIKAKNLYPYHTMGTDPKLTESINVSDSIVKIRNFGK